MSISVRKKKDGTKVYLAQTFVYKKRVSKTFPNKKEANFWILEQSNNKNFNIVGRKIKVSEAISQFVKECSSHYKSKTIFDHLKFWDHYLGSVFLSELTPVIVQSQINHIKTVSFNHYLSSLSSVMTKCVKKWHYLQTNPCLKVEKRKTNKSRTRFLIKEEISRLIDACKASESRLLYPIVLIALATGMRRGEIFNLTWENVDLDSESFLLIDTKNGENRRVFFNEKVLAYLKKNKKQIGKVFEIKDIKTSFKTALKKAGIEDFRFHDLRHTAASYLAMNGASLLEIADVLGHKTLSMVKRYSHLLESHKKKVMENLSNSIFQQ